MLTPHCLHADFYLSEGMNSMKYIRDNSFPVTNTLPVTYIPLPVTHIISNLHDPITYIPVLSYAHPAEIFNR
jgi:hypothetical protein